MCGASPRFSQVIVVPTETSIVGGLKAKSSIPIVSVVAGVVDSSMGASGSSVSPSTGLAGEASGSLSKSMRDPLDSPVSVTLSSSEAGRISKPECTGQRVVRVVELSGIAQNQRSHVLVLLIEQEGNAVCRVTAGVIGLPGAEAMTRRARKGI